LKLVIECAAGSIRLTDPRLSVGDQAELGDVLREMVDALRLVSGDEIPQVGNALSSFGFKVPERVIGDDEPEEDE
jgi:hypothetical protein